MISILRDLRCRGDQNRLKAWEAVENTDVIYVENEWDERINAFIVRNYADIVEMFKRKNKDFYYIPRATEDLSIIGMSRQRYMIPWQEDVLELSQMTTAEFTAMLYPEWNLQTIRPSLLIGDRKMWSIEQTEPLRVSFPEEGDDNALMWWLDGFFTPTLEKVKKDSGIRCGCAIFARLRELNDHLGDNLLYDDEVPSEDGDNASSVQESRPTCGTSSGNRATTTNEGTDHIERNFNLSNVCLCDDEEPLTEEELRMQEAEKHIRWLSSHGIQRQLLEEMIRRAYGNTEPQLSTLHVTQKLEIVLLDYQGMKIELRPIDKAVYLTFLSEREGINFKDITDYKEDMWNWYRRLTNVNEKKAWETVERMMESDALSQSLRKIRLAFLEKFDDSLAQFYYLSGEQGKEKSVHLPAELVVWEEFQ